MKISDLESLKASASMGTPEARILPTDRSKGRAGSRTGASRRLTPLEKGMEVAEAALANVPDTRDEIVSELKERIQKGEYKVSGKEVAEMMLRRRAADKIR